MMMENEGAAVLPIGAEQLKKLEQIREKYRTGKKSIESRAIAAENWWKLKNQTEEDKTKEVQVPGWRASSGWLHNVIVSKHADAIEAYPQPVILPRESGDKEEAERLSSIIPCVLEQAGFEEAYDANAWKKIKFGTGVYKVIWDAGKLHGLGDISIEPVSLLNLFWEPGVTDLQKSEYVFHTEMMSKETIERLWPQTVGKLGGKPRESAKFSYDDTVDTSDKYTVVDAYYHKGDVLHYCKYVGENVLYATENDTEPPTETRQGVDAAGLPVTEEVPVGQSAAERGLYDHGKYPFVTDALFPIEGSPCGYGYIDLCKKAQEEIDMLKTACVSNAMAGAKPRYFARADGTVNETEFLDTTKPIVHVAGNISDDALRPITTTNLDGVYVSLMNNTIQELRETSGNTETATGSTNSGVTAASAIAALQEASGKGSRASTKAAYRAFSTIVSMCIELVRQFYDLPRQFRIIGKGGEEEYITYTNEKIKEQHQGNDFGMDMGYRLPAFDIKVSAQKQNVYTTISNNEMALQFFKLGFFDPARADQAAMCMDMMDFPGKESLLRDVRKRGGLMETLQMVEQYAANLAAKYADNGALQQLQQIMAQTGQTMPVPQAAQGQTPPSEEPTMVKNSRERAQQASQPGGGR